MEGHALFKIGSAFDVQTRLAALQIGCPEVLHVRKAYPSLHPESVEKQLHRFLAASQRTDEWFETDLAIINEAVKDLTPQTWELLQQCEQGEYELTGD